MSVELPAPLVPAECDLRDFYFMPLDVARLRDCRFAYASSGDGFRSAVLLWCASWHQLPAASLPDDDVELAHLAGFGRVVSEWLKIKSEAMHGFILCSDGRWYHPHIAAEARKAWAEHLRIMGRENRRLEMMGGEWEEIRKLVFVRDDYTCTYCGSRGVRLECDHVVPISRGGKTELSNLVTACLSCNRSKGRKSVGEWLQ